MTEKTFTMDNFDVVCDSEDYSYLSYALTKALEELCKLSAEPHAGFYGMSYTVTGKTGNKNGESTMIFRFAVDDNKLALVRIGLFTANEDLVTHVELEPDDHYIGVDPDGCGYTFFVDRLAEALKDTFTRDWL